MNVTVPCEICGESVAFIAPNTVRCFNCWEMEERLKKYMKAPLALEVIRKYIPIIDDWVDGMPDSWDYEKVLKDHGANVIWSNTIVDGLGNESPAGEFSEWVLCWKYGIIGLGCATETIAKKAGAMFICLWLRGFSASFADKLVDGFITFLNRQERGRYPAG